MADLIDRAALLDKLELLAKYEDPFRETVIRGVMFTIRSETAVDAEPVKPGEWVGTADGYAEGELVYDMWECSECGYDADGADEKPNWNFCPNCGADMRERKET